MRSPFVKLASRHAHAVRRSFALKTAFVHSARNSWRTKLLQLLLCGLAALISAELRADCPTMVSASVDNAAARLYLNVSVGGSSCGQSTFTVKIDDEEVISHNCGPTGCAEAYNLSSACYATGSHEVTVNATCAQQVGDSCEGHSGTATTSFTTNLTPTISISATPTATIGIYRVSAPYTFPNTNHPLNRFVSIYQVRPDGSREKIYTYTSPAPALDAVGTIAFDLNTQCWSNGTHQLEAIAEACGKEEAKNQTPITIDHHPEVDVDVEPDANGYLWAKVTYNFPENNHNGQQSLRLDWLPSKTRAGSWIETNNPVIPAVAGVWSYPLGYPPADQEMIRATATACGSDTETSDAAVPAADRTCCSIPGANVQQLSIALSQGNPASCVSGPIRLSTGNMRYSERDPLPGPAEIPLVRVYDSNQSEVAGVFGKGWSSLFDAWLVSYNNELVVLATEMNERATFAKRLGNWQQTWPRGMLLLPSFSVGADGSFTYREGGSRITRQFSAAGRLSAYADLSSDRTVTITYDANGLPTAVADNRGNWRWTILTDVTNRRITTISVDGRPDASWSFTYGADNRLLSVGLSSGQVWRQYEYATGRLAVIRDAAGKVIEEHAYDAAGRAQTSFSASDRITNIQYGLVGSQPGETITRVTMANGEQTDYQIKHFAGRARTTAVTGGCTSCGGADTVYAYSKNGAVVRQQDGRGYISQLQGAGGNTMLTLTAYRPATCDPETDPQRCRLTSEALAAVAIVGTSVSTATYATYDPYLWQGVYSQDQPTEIRTASVGNPSESRREVFTFDPVGGEIASYSIIGWTGNPAVEQTRTTVTARYDGLEGAAFEPGGPFAASWLTLAQPRNRKSIDGPTNGTVDQTLFVYYPIDPAVPATWRGQLAAVRNPAGMITLLENYDVFGNATRTTDHNGVVTEATLDALGRLLTSTVKGLGSCDTAADPLCATDLTSSWSYLAVTGGLGTETRPSGGVAQYQYDAYGRVSALSRGPAINDLRDRIEYDFDPGTGNKSQERYLAGATERKRTSYSYYGDGQLKEIIHGDNTRIIYTYDAIGNLASVQDEKHLAANTTYVYDAANRLTAVTQTLGGGTAITRYAYDPHGNLVAVTDPNGNVTTYVFDDFGQMIQQTSPVTGVTTYSYDQEGNLLSTTDANGAVTTRTYDALGRILTGTSTRSGVPAETVSWSYDDASAGIFGNGRVRSMTDPSGSTTYAYERRGLLRSEARSILGSSYTQSYSYDADGNRNRLTYPSGRIVNYTFDYAGRPFSVTSGTTTFISSATYEPFGPMKQLVYGNGTTKTFTWDSRYRPSRNMLTGPIGTIADYGYSADNVGNITAISDQQDPGYNRTFGYDDLHRLTTANSGAKLWGNGSYAYDAMGNMLNLSLGTYRSGTFTHRGTTPQLLSATENGMIRNVAYDAAGNELTVGDRAAVYTPRNYLDAADGISYIYDGRGIRIASAPQSARAVASLITGSPLVGGSPATGMLSLTAPAPSEGAVITLTSSNPAVATVPSSVTVSAGNTEASFPITTPSVSSVDQAVISATHGAQYSVLVFVQPPAAELSGISTAAASVAGGNSTTGTVTLTALAPFGGIAVTLTSSDSAVTVPAAILVPEAAASATFAISTTSVATTTQAALTASWNAISKTAVLEVTPVALGTLTISPSSRIGGNATTGTITLTGPAPGGGISVAISSSNAAVASAAATLILTPGSTSSSFQVTTMGVTALTQVTITATSSNALTATVTVTPATITSLDVAPVSVAGGSATTATMTLDGAAPPGAAEVTLTSSNTNVATPPASAIVPAGASSTTAQVPTKNVAASTAVVISGTYGGITRSAPLTVNPCVPAPPPPPPGSFPAHEVVWFDDAGPGGTLEPPPWVWDSTQKASGTQSHTDAQASGSHYHGFYNAPGTLTPGAGDKLFTYVMIDPCNPPAEITLSWSTTGVASGPRAYWGANLIQYAGEPAPYRVGDLPAAGQWVRLEVPANRVGKMGLLLTGMRFTLYGGKAWFDRAGVERCLVAPVSPPESFPADVVWMDDDVPAGTTSQTGLIWDTSQKASGTRSHTDTPKSGVHSHQVFFPVKAIGANEKLVAYVLLSSCAAPRAIMLNWLDANGLGEHRAYWGENLIMGGADGTANRYMGPLPPVGVWTRLEVTPSLVNITSTKGVYFRQYDGQAWWDWVGKNTGTAMTSQGPSLAQIEESVDEGPAGDDSVAPTQEAQVSVVQRSGRRALSFAATTVSRIGSLFRRRKPLALEFSYTPLPVGRGPGVRENPSPLPVGEGSGVRAESTVLLAQAAARPRAASTRRAPRGTIAASSYTAGDKKRFYFYTPELNLLSVTETTEAAAPAIAYDYLWFGGEPLAQINNSIGEVAYYFNDHLGTPILQTDAQAQVVWRAEYEPYGQVFTLRAGEGRHQPLRLPGQEAEQFESGANGVTERSYNIFRWYRSAWGKYTQPDPIRDRYLQLLLGPELPILRFVRPQLSSEPETSWFAYTNGRPTFFTDPFGLAQQRPGCDEVGLDCFETRKLKNCCECHDACFFLVPCTWTSWGRTIVGLAQPLKPKGRCETCNLWTVGCVVKARFGISSECPWPTPRQMYE